MSKTLEEVLADWAEQANVLRRRKHGAEADSIDEIVNDVRSAAEDYITWLSESAAHMRSGRSMAWLRGHFTEWLAEGHAELRGHVRYYRQCVVPQRTHPSVAAEQGRMAGERARHAS